MAGYKVESSRKLTAAQKRSLVEEVRDAIEESYNFELDNRLEAQTDLQFLAGDQWPEFAKKQRGTTRPMITINHLPQFVRQVTNPTRESDISIDVKPESDADVPIAKIYKGLIRQIEYLSTAKTVYVTGNEHQTSCGIGWWQVCTSYVDDAIFDQEIKIKRIENPLSVYCDPAAIEPDRSDAMWIGVVENWPRKTFEKKYPDQAVSDVDVPDGAVGNPAGMQWSTKDTVAVCMFFKKVPSKKLLAQTQSGRTIDITDKGEGELGALDQADPIVKVRECETFKVEKYLVTGTDVLEGPIAWAGKYIPLIPVIGAEIPTKKGTLRHGVVRFARDPQQLVNFYETATAEAIALAPKAPYLVTPKQVGAHKAMWDTLNTENRPYLFYTPDQETPGAPKREAPPETPVALMQQANNSVENIRRTTGVYESALGARSNETSGIAIQKRETQSDNANSHFGDNLVQSLTHTGRVLVDLIPKIYDNERVVRLMDEKGKEQSITINQVVMRVDGIPIVYNDLSVGRFDVRVTVGKNYLTKRVESLSMMLEFAKALPPEAQMLFIDLIVSNSDWPGAEELAKRFRNMVPPQALADLNDPNAPQPPGPMDDPMTVVALEKIAAEIEQIKANAMKTQADIQKVGADTSKVYADTVKVLAEAENLDADTDHNIVIPSVTGEVPSPSPRKPNGAQAPPG